MATFVDHYAVLGIEPTANADEIKKTYRRLALKYHPDKAAPGSKADSSKFIGILAAYEVLFDDSKRKPYDVQYKKHSNGTATHQATHATRPRQGETSGVFSADFWSYPEHFGEGSKVPGAFPSDDDDASESGYQYEDAEAYEEAYDRRHYTSCYAGDFSFDNSGLYTQGFDAKDNRHQFLDDFADDASPAQGYGNESRSESDHHRDKENIAPRICDPISQAFDILSDILEAHHLGEKVKGRCYENAQDELRLQKRRCKEIDTQLDDLDGRLRRCVGTMPAGSVPLQDFERSLKRSMNTAHRAVRVTQLQIEQAIFVVRHELKPRSWKATSTTTRGIINTIEKSADDLAQMKQGLAGLDSIVTKMEGWKISDLRQLKGCLDSFMFDLRDWCEEIASRP